ncbi:hypothetical protein E2562_027908 [Oryza meyeriana var. granulata]|uniref:Uncharacterized protein n=1 Tax=Oryza meyeriana var. granulata TaxID=110450 RepID=A0A6G1EZL1_9ORYZ|nr:hypothetical protein E2562_031559 [Oryza meyeriana var. granulata]KAF0930074.1 hypothetical protein E2562_027908 [Oryza meyeriana var. granulata]
MMVRGRLVLAAEKVSMETSGPRKRRRTSSSMVVTWDLTQDMGSADPVAMAAASSRELAGLGEGAASVLGGVASLDAQAVGLQCFLPAAMKTGRSIMKV